MWILQSVLLFSLFFSVYTWKIFFRGREVGGNIGQPLAESNYLDDIPEEWFTQNLDHFNPTEDRTWQQVSFKLNCVLFQHSLFKFH